MGKKFIIHAKNTNTVCITHICNTNVKNCMNFWFTYNYQGLPGSISAGRSHALHCVAEGSRPAADITWWKDGKVGKHNNWWKITF